MRKRLISEPDGPSVLTDSQPWLDLQKLAVVEVTSEHPQHPVEHAVQAGGSGWTASEPGRQTIRLIFDEPQTVRRIRLEFREPSAERTQEFTLRWSERSEPGAMREIVRQQWNFSPPGTTAEVEDYSVSLSNVLLLELSIIPNISGGSDRALLYALRIA